MSETKLVINPENQTAILHKGSEVYKTHIISTSKHGLGCKEGSNKTPIGLFKVAAKFGDDEEIGTVFRSRESTGEIWTPDKANPLNGGKRDLILTRILWLSGLEDFNKNTVRRYIYMHGTRRESGLGTPQSAGCVNFKNTDIIELFDNMSVGDNVEILDKEYMPIAGNL